MMRSRTGALLIAALLIHSLNVNSQKDPGNGTGTKANPGFPAGAYPILLEAVLAADLAEVLKNGSYTVFAPTDAAFRKLEVMRTGELLSPENKSRLKSLVTYHIVAGEFTAARILKALSQGKGTTRFTTVQGEELIASMEGTDIVLTDCSGNRARVVCADNGRSNLVFHEIDTVVLPEPL